jgi:predicted membrane protein
MPVMPTMPYGVPPPTLPKHRFDPNQPESAVNYNFETCYDGEYPDMNGSQLIGTGIIGSRKTEVKYLARINSIRSNIGLSVVDIRGARIFNGETQIVFDGTIGKIILVVPLYCALTIDDSYCIGEVFTHRPCEVSINDAMQKGLPIIRVMIKNTVGDINIIEKEYNVNVTSESLNNELKRLRKNYSKNNKNNNNKQNQNNINDGSGGTKLVSVKTMFMKSFNNAKQQLSGNPGSKPVNTAPYPYPNPYSNSYPNPY